MSLATTTTSALTLQHVAYSQSDLSLLSGINFSLSYGQIVGLLGVNGAGKSTTLKIAAGILHPDSGNVIHPTDIRIGYVPEIPPLLPTWTVKQFLQHACLLQHLPISTHQTAVRRVNELCDLHAIQHQHCATLSKGNQQRVAIAQALLHQPDILILDEPTSGLDPQQIYRFRDLLQTLKTDTAIILSSHIMQEITALCDRTIILHDGKQVGELDFSERNQRLLIEFSHAVSSDCFADTATWQSGNGTHHQFRLSNETSKNDILAYCLEKQLPIQRMTGIEDLAEQDFLTLIGYKDSVDHEEQYA